MKKYWKIEELIKSLKDDGNRSWADERCVMLPLETFTPVFYAKYAPTVDFSFEFSFKGSPHILATNIGGFQYKFPVTKN